MTTTDPERERTHYVGDSCPGGHRGEATTDPVDEAREALAGALECGLFQCHDGPEFYCEHEAAARAALGEGE